mgnify:CR=1 FL=1
MVNVVMPMGCLKGCQRHTDKESTPAEIRTVLLKTNVNLSKSADWDGYLLRENQS